MMLTGLTVANIVGVPLTTLLGQHLGWQWPYALVGVIAAVHGRGVWCWVPFCPPDGAASMASRAARAAAAAGVAGPADRHRRLRRHVRDVLLHRPDDDRARRLRRGDDPADPRASTACGMTAGAILSGRVAAHGPDAGHLRARLAAIAVVLALFGFAAHAPGPAVVAVFLLGPAAERSSCRCCRRG